MVFVQDFIKAKRRSDKDVLKNSFRSPCTLHIQHLKMKIGFQIQGLQQCETVFCKHSRNTQWRS